MFARQITYNDTNAMRTKGVQSDCLPDIHKAKPIKKQNGHRFIRKSSQQSVNTL